MLVDASLALLLLSRSVVGLCATAAEHEEHHASKQQQQQLGQRHGIVKESSRPPCACV